MVIDMWKTMELGQVATLQRGYDLPYQYRKPGPVPIVTSSGINDTHDYARVAGPGVVTGRYGTIGEVFFIKEDFWPLNTTLFVKNFHDNDPLFVSYLLRTIDFHSHSGKSGVPGVNRNDLHSLTVTVPKSVDEQRTIAAALSDVDTLLAKLDQLIAKKRDIKQAAMQQLLTGKKRLPGFSGEWEVKRLGDVGIFRGGSGFPTRYQGNVEGDYPFYKVSDMNNDGNSTFMVSSNNRITEDIRKQTGANTFPTNTIVFAKIGAAIFLERKKILTQESCIDNNMMGFVLDDRVAYHRFVHYLFLSIQLGRLVAATALPSLNGKEIAGLLYGIPSLPEQQTIAAVLSDMDAEIAALEARRDKTRDLKQGMMQELLTGRIRLVGGKA